MFEYYNKYINHINPDNSYISEIAFVNTNNTFISDEIAFVEYIDDNKWKKGIFKMTDELSKIYLEFRTNSNYTNERIKNIQYSKTNHSYIKIIKDNNNPQLEGKIMIFKFGRKIFDEIVYECETLNDHGYIIDKSFKLNISRIGAFPNFDYSQFTNNKYKIEDYSLDIRNDINFKTLSISNIIRKEKLKELSNL